MAPCRLCEVCYIQQLLLYISILLAWPAYLCHMPMHICTHSSNTARSRPADYGEVCEIQQLNLDVNSPASDIENRNLNGVYYYRECSGLPLLTECLAGLGLSWAT